MQENIYLPSSSERKRVITAYLLVGVLFFSAKEDLTVYEYFHFRQVLGWYALTMLLLLVWLMIFRIPILGWLPFLFVLANLILYVVFVVQARKGQYLSNLTQENKWKTLYADIGGWILSLFDIKKRVYGDISLDMPNLVPNQIPDQAPNQTPNQDVSAQTTPTSLQDPQAGGQLQ